MTLILLFHVRLFAWHGKFEKCKVLKKELNEGINVSVASKQLVGLVCTRR